jgi:hypothetical protein
MIGLVSKRHGNSQRRTGSELNAKLLLIHWSGEAIPENEPANSGACAGTGNSGKERRREQPANRPARIQDCIGLGSAVMKFKVFGSMAGD